jgi:transketolase N-terminal domain/subunit
MIVLVGDAELDESNVYEALLMLKARTTQYLMDH